MTEIPAEVTVCITSCGRLDLLQQTLASFRSHHSGGRFILHEDSCDPETIETVKRLYPDFLVLAGEERRGLMKSIDALYEAVETPYIFHLEDDWEFSGPVNWHAAMSLLTENRDVANVCVRRFTDIKPKWTRTSRSITHEGQAFQHMRKDAHPEFFGWSSNPGLISKDLYREFAPFGRAMHDQISRIIKDEGRTMAYMLPGVASHLGAGRNVTDPTFKPRPKSALGKLKRAIQKKLYYAGWKSDPF